MDRVEKAVLIVSNTPFTESGIVEKREMDLSSIIEINKTETGIINGVPYDIYYTDGSGTFGGVEGATKVELDQDNWTVACEKDSISDKKSCYIQRHDLWIWLYENGNLKISIGRDYYPSSTIAIRVDSRKPFYTSADNGGFFPSAQTKNIIAQLKSGKKVTTKYVKWPYGSAVDESFGLYGLNEAYLYIQWAIKKIR